LRSASLRLTIPNGSFSGPERRTSGAMISRFRRCLRSSRWRRARNSVAMVQILQFICHRRWLTLPQCTRARASFNDESAFVLDVLGDPLRERFERHHTEVLVAPGAHCNSPCGLLLVADDEDIWQLLHRVLPYFIRNF